jgi:hypothetical protein
MYGLKNLATPNPRHGTRDPGLNTRGLRLETAALLSSMLCALRSLDSRFKARYLEQAFGYELFFYSSIIKYCNITNKQIYETTQIH